MTILLSDCVAEVESSNSPYAMRFEANYTVSNGAARQIQKYATACYMDQNTALNIGRTSWGRFQIMGANLYTMLKCQAPIVHFLEDDEMQLNFFNAFCENIGFENSDFQNYLDNPDELLSFARCYNGSEIYAESLKAAFEKLSNAE